MSLFDKPSDAKSITLHSRSVSTVRMRLSLLAPGIPSKGAIGNTLRPAATCRKQYTKISGAASLEITLCAPWQPAYGRSSTAVSKMTRVHKPSNVAAARISAPVRPGKEMSSTAMSGDKARMAWRHFVPSPQLATTLNPFSARRRAVRPHRTTGWRSAMTTLTQLTAHLCNAHATSYRSVGEVLHNLSLLMCDKSHTLDRACFDQQVTPTGKLATPSLVDCREGSVGLRRRCSPACPCLCSVARHAVVAPTDATPTRANCKVEEWPGSLGGNAPFPLPAHRTGRAELRHPALGQDLRPSPSGSREQATPA